MPLRQPSSVGVAGLRNMIPCDGHPLLFVVLLRCCPARTCCLHPGSHARLQSKPADRLLAQAWRAMHLRSLHPCWPSETALQGGGSVAVLEHLACTTVLAGRRRLPP